MGENSYKYSENELDVMSEVDMFMGDVKETSYGEVEIPDTLRMGIRKHVDACEEAKLESKVSKADQEYIRLGKIYQKKRKLRKYYVLAAVLVLGFLLGMTSMGGPEKVFEKIHESVFGRERTKVNSDTIKEVTGLDEEKAYQQVEEKFGFYPVKLDYLPEGVEFVRANIHEEIQECHLIYGRGSMANVTYIIRPNYRDSSYGMDFEDELLEEYVSETNGISAMVREYQVKDTKEIRWTAEFEYADVNYVIVCLGVEEQDFEEILKNLYFF